MESSKTSLTSEIEELVKKAAEANKVFINEGAKLVQQMGKNTSGKQQIPSVQPELLMDVFNSMVKLNIQHTSKLIDIGISFAKKITGQEEDVTEQVFKDDTHTGTHQPAFELRAEIKAGETTTVPFLLDNIKKETVICQLVQSDFVHQSDASIKPGFQADFHPQSFPLEPSETKKVNIIVATQADAAPGVYLCHVQVLGFEPAFFSLYLTVN
jgi:hypothetical protein